jgi:hypothetical protein
VGNKNFDFSKILTFTNATDHGLVGCSRAMRLPHIKPAANKHTPFQPRACHMDSITSLLQIWTEISPPPAAGFAAFIGIIIH